MDNTKWFATARPVTDLHKLSASLTKTHLFGDGSQPLLRCWRRGLVFQLPKRPHCFLPSFSDQPAHVVMNAEMALSQFRFHLNACFEQILHQLLPSASVLLLRSEITRYQVSTKKATLPKRDVVKPWSCMLSNFEKIIKKRGKIRALYLYKSSRALRISFLNIVCIWSFIGKSHVFQNSVL